MASLGRWWIFMAKVKEALMALVRFPGDFNIHDDFERLWDGATFIYLLQGAMRRAKALLFVPAALIFSFVLRRRVVCFYVRLLAEVRWVRVDEYAFFWGLISRAWHGRRVVGGAVGEMC